MVRTATMAIRRTLEWALLAFVLVLAVYVSIGRISMAALDSYRSEIQQLVADSLGTSVEIKQLSGSWIYLDPVLGLNELRLGNDQGIRLGEARVRVDAIRSLMSQRVVITELLIADLVMDIEQQSDGGWQVKGLPSRGKPLRLDPLLDAIGDVKTASVSSFVIGIKALNGRFLLTDAQERSEEKEKAESLRDDLEEVSRKLVQALGVGWGFDDIGESISVAVEDYDGVKVVSIPLMLVNLDTKERLPAYVGGQYAGNPRLWDVFQSKLYLRLPSVDLAAFLSDEALGGYSLATLPASGEVWVNVDGGDWDIRVQVKTSEIAIRKDDTKMSLAQNVQLTAAAVRSDQDTWQASITELTLSSGKQAYEIGKIDLELNLRDSLKIAGRIPDLDIAELADLANRIDQEYSILPANADGAIASLNPKGRVNNVLFFVNQADPAQTRLVALLDGVTVSSYRNSPAVSRLDGLVSIGPRQGYIDFNNQEFELQFEPMFPAPWSFDYAKGRLRYVVDDAVSRLSSSLIEAGHQSLKAAGQLQINFTQNVDDRNWALLVGIENADLGDASRYLPNNLGEGLINWLNRSILSGSATESGLMFHGPLIKQKLHIGKVYELFFKVDQTRLDYHPDWPLIDNLKSDIYIGNWGVFTEGASGAILDSQIDQAVVHIPVVFGEKANLIEIDGRLSGPLADGIKVLNDTPIAAMTSNMAAGWEGDGPMIGNLHLEIPIGPDAASRKAEAEVAINLKSNQIYMPQYNLDIRDLDSQIQYSTVNGLSTRSFEALLFGKPVNGDIKSLQAGDGGKITVSVLGDVDVADLYKWSSQPLLTQADGVMSYDAKLTIPYGSRAAEEDIKILATSNLVGVTINLPAPVRKASHAPADFRYLQTFSDPYPSIDIQYNKDVSAYLLLADDMVHRGRVQFGESTASLPAEGLVVGGNIAYVDYDKWQLSLAALDERSEVSLESEMVSRLRGINLEIGQLDAFGLHLTDVSTQINREAAGWKVMLENEMLKGGVSIHDDDVKPLLISLDYLRFPEVESADVELAEGEKQGPEIDPFTDTDPKDYIAVDFETKALFLGENDFGSWKFQFRPTSDGVVMDQLVAEVRGLKILENSKVLWTAGETGHQSAFIGTIEAPDLVTVLEKWGIASSIIGKDVKLDVDINWPGSPAVLATDKIAGNVSFTTGAGSFVQANNTGPLKLLGIFDFASIAKRFRFDFSDIVDKGYTFDKITGEVIFNQGVVSVVTPVKIEGSSSIFTIGGQVDLNSRELDNDMIVTLPVNRNLPWYAAYSAIFTGPLVGASVFIAQKVFENQIDQFSSAKYRISGTVDDPLIEFVSIFSDRVREVTAETGVPGE